MTTSELVRLNEALKAHWPDARVEVHGAQLVVEAGTTRLISAATMDWRALSMEEWLHRITSVLRRLPS